MTSTATSTARPVDASVPTRGWGPFTLVASLVMLALATSSTPSPLYSIYQGEWGFDAFSLTKVFAVYALAVLGMLIVAGGLSDIIGRRPVIYVATAVLVVAALIFMFAQGIAWLYVGRVVQGIAMGLLLGASGAALIDLHPRGDAAHAGMVNGIINTLGLGLGALVSGILVQAVPGNMVLPWVPLTISLVVVGLIAIRIPETVRRVPGARFSMRPPGVPRAVLPVFLLASLGVIASWSNAGLYIALGPGMVSQLLETDNHVVGGAFIFGVTGAAALAQFLLRNASNRIALVGGALALTVGSVLAAVGFDGDLPALFIGGAIVVGFGFGAAFLGALRAFSMVLPPLARASGMSAFFVVAYLSMGVPAVGAGLALRHVDAATTLDWFGGTVAVVALGVAVFGFFHLRDRDLRDEPAVVTGSFAD